jgi:hypothetical protein
MIQDMMMAVPPTPGAQLKAAATVLPGSIEEAAATESLKGTYFGSADHGPVQRTLGEVFGAWLPFIVLIVAVLALLPPWVLLYNPHGTLDLHVSGDMYKGDPQIQVLVDGKQVGGTYDITAHHSQGQTQEVTINGPFDSTMAHQVQITFVNDAWDGTAAADGHDRNVYVSGITMNSQNINGSQGTNTATNGVVQTSNSNEAVMDMNGTFTWHVPANPLAGSSSRSGSHPTTTSTTIAPTISPAGTSGTTVAFDPNNPGGSGYSIAFDDEFNGTSLDTTKWYTERPFGYGTLSPSYYSVANGHLTLSGDGVGPNYSIATVGPGMAGFAESGGGYFEARIRYSGTRSGSDGWPSFWSMAAEHLFGTETSHFLEADFMEYFGGIYGGSATSYSATTHDWVNGRSQFDTRSAEGASDGNWHTFGARWLPGSAWIYYLDGKEIGRTSYSPGGTYSIGDSEHMPVILGTANGWPMDVDWVRVWKPATSG